MLISSTQQGEHIPTTSCFPLATSEGEREGGREEAAGGSSAPRPSKMRGWDTLHHTASLAADVFLWHQEQLVEIVPCQEPGTQQENSWEGVWCGQLAEGGTDPFSLGQDFWFPMALHVAVFPVG